MVVSSAAYLCYYLSVLYLGVLIRQTGTHPFVRPIFVAVRSSHLIRHSNTCRERFSRRPCVAAGPCDSWICARHVVYLLPWHHRNLHRLDYWRIQTGLPASTIVCRLWIHHRWAHRKRNRGCRLDSHIDLHQRRSCADVCCCHERIDRSWSLHNRIQCFRYDRLLFTWPTKDIQER